MKGKMKSIREEEDRVRLTLIQEEITFPKMLSSREELIEILLKWGQDVEGGRRDKELSVVRREKSPHRGTAQTR